MFTVLVCLVGLCWCGGCVGFWGFWVGGFKDGYGGV